MKKKGSAKPAKKISSQKDLSQLAYPEHLRESEVIETLRKTVRRLKVFDSLGKTLTSSLQLSEIIQVIVEKIGQLVDSQKCTLVLLADDSKEFQIEYPHDLSEDQRSLPSQSSLLSRCLQRGKSELLIDPTLDPHFSAKVDGLVVKEPSSLMMVPIMSKGMVHGVVCFYTENFEKPFDKERFEVLETFSDYLAIAIENARNYKKVQDLTITDDLTKLYNSRYLHIVLERELVRAERYQEQVALVFIDLDNFKQVNDINGHLAGSRLLTEVGDFLIREIRKTDIAIRYGGDEFVIVLPKTSKELAVLVVQRMITKLHDHVFLKSKKINLQITASFGLACYPEDAKSMDQLISAADKAMYVVKKGSKDGLHYEPTTQLAKGQK